MLFAFLGLNGQTQAFPQEPEINKEVNNPTIKPPSTSISSSYNSFASHTDTHNIFDYDLSAQHSLKEYFHADIVTEFLYIK